MEPAGDCLSCGAGAGWSRVCELVAIDAPDRFTLVRCQNCGVMRTLPVPAELSGYYETPLGRTMWTGGTGAYTRLQRVQLRREARRMGSPADGTVLDIGSGTGAFAVLLHRRGFRVVTADVGGQPPVAVRDGGIAHGAIDFERYTLSGLEVPGPYCVVLRHVLEHVRDPAAFLQRLKEQGATRFYVVVPNTDCIERRLFGRYWYLWDPPRHLWHYDARSLRALCRRVDLRVAALGYDTIPNLVASAYRALCVHGVRLAWREILAPKGTLAAVMAPANLLLPRNVLWAVADV